MNPNNAWKNMKKSLIISCQIYFAVSLGGCAFDVIRVQQFPAKLVIDESCDGSFTLLHDVDIDLRGVYNRKLKNGTRWDCIGKIVQGNVYKTADQVLTVEASNIYEANIVVSSKKLVGFYLPVERTFSPLERKLGLEYK